MGLFGHLQQVCLPIPSAGANKPPSPHARTLLSGVSCPPDVHNPYAPGMAYFELFELARYFRAHGKEYEPIHRHGPGLYEGLRNHEVYRFTYDPLRIETVPAHQRQEVLEKSRSVQGRGQ